MYRLALAIVVAVGLTVIVLATLPLKASRATTVTCDGDWHVVSGPTGLGQLSQLYGVAGTSPTDVWAVGSNGDPLIEHWDGSEWSVVPGPAIPGGSLYDVAAISLDDVWAVGSTGTSTLIEHWNGTNWSVVPSPTPTSSISQLSSVAAVSPNDVWAVGSDGKRTLIEHWNGTNWSIVASPVPANSITHFTSVSAISSDDVWAVGFSSTGPGASQIFSAHWNGEIWGVRLGPSAGAFSGVGAAAADVWAVGAVDSQTLTERWDGNQWNIVASPNPGLSSNDLASVVVVSPSDAWAVGAAASNVGPSIDVKPLIEHWDGSEWSVVPVANVGGPEAILYDVSAPAPNDLWAVGYVGSIVGSLSASTLILHMCDAPLASTLLTGNVQVGMIELPVESHEGFALGDHILIDPGGSSEEANRISGFASILLASPLVNTHTAGESVVRILAGDGDCSGSVTIDDVMGLLRRVAEVVPTATCSEAWDADCNSNLTAIDAIFMLMAITDTAALLGSSECRLVGA